MTLRTCARDLNRWLTTAANIPVARLHCQSINIYNQLSKLERVLRCCQLVTISSFSSKARSGDMERRRQILKLGSSLRNSGKVPARQKERIRENLSVD